MHRLPGPRRLPLVGNLHQIELSRLHLTLEDWARRYGSAYRIGLGRRPNLVLSDPELIRAVLRDRPEGFRRNRTLETVLSEMGISGVFSAEGAAWRPQRRLATAALSRSHIQGFFPTLRLGGERLLRRWQRAADQGAIVNILTDFQRFAVDVMTSLSFGRDVNTIEDGGGGVHELLETVFPVLARRLNARVPIWRWLPSDADRALDDALVELRAWLGAIIAEARSELAANPDGVTKNFLEAMLHARDEDGAAFDEAALFGNALTMLLAGEDTTASSLAWAVHELSDDAEVVARLRAELDGEISSAVPKTLREVARLPYALAVAEETLRLRPAAPVLLMESNRDAVLGEDIAVPAGTRVLLLTRLAAISEAYVPEPQRFLPARWLDRERASELLRRGVHLPFGSGPRLCPGRNLAFIEMQMMLAVLYRNFEVERIGPRSAVAENYGFTMTPHRLRVRLRRRAHAPAPHAAAAPRMEQR